MSSANPGPSGPQTVEPAAYCMELVQESDYDSYLCGLLYPKEARRSFFAIRAFNCEIARIKDQVHGNAMTGSIRFQWWNDQIDKIYVTSADESNSFDHPVAQELAIAVHSHRLTKRLFERCLEARQKDMHMHRIDSLSDLEDHAEGAHSSLIYLALQVLGVNNTNADYCASHVGVCTGLATLLRGTAFHASKGNIYIPRETAEKVNLTDSVLVKGPQTEAEATAVKEAVFDVAAQAHGHLERAREILAGKGGSSNSDDSGSGSTSSSSSGSNNSSSSGGDGSDGVSGVADGESSRESTDQKLHPDAIYAFMPAVRSAMVLDDLQGVGFDPFHPTILGKRPALKYQLKLLRSMLFKTF